MIKKTADSEVSLTTVKGITSELYASVIQYFAPVVAIYKAFEATAGMPTIKGEWPSRRMDKNQG